MVWIRNGDLWRLNAEEDGPRSWNRILASAEHRGTGGGGNAGGGMTARRPIFSPDGRKIAFHMERQSGSGSTSIWMLDVGNGRSYKVMDEATCPCFSPGGTMLIYAADDGNIYSSSLDGRNKKRLISDGASPAY
jgi:hypothetical protein